MTLKETIFDLCNILAPSGFEIPAYERASELLAPYVDEIKTDAMGNLIAVKKCGKENAKKLLLDAHNDEIGFIVTGIDKSGFLRFSNLGGVDPRMLPALEVVVLADTPIHGIIDTMPPHALSADDMGKTIKADQLFIDVGLSEEEAKKKIPLGTPCSFASGVHTLGESCICGKSMDDRACVAIIIKAMEELKDKELDMDIYCLFSTQEELGMRGAIVGAFGIEPDFAIALDVTHGETPDSKKGDTSYMRKGPALCKGPNLHRGLTKKIEDTAKKCEIPYQVEVANGCSGTNAWIFQVSRCGVPSALISLPLKYMHTPVETMDINDGENCVKLLAEVIKGFEKEEN